MLKGLFGWGKRAAPVTVREPARPAPPIGAARPAAPAEPAPTLARPPAAVSGREPGELLGGVYPVLRRLGEGGFGEVFLCRHPAWNIEVAVKLPKPEALADPRTLPDLQREAEEWTGLGLHPYIAYCYHLHPVGELPRTDLWSCARKRRRRTSKRWSFSVSARRFVLCAAESHSTMAVSAVQHA